MSEIQIDVTQEDIDKGRRGHCELCPIARALQRATGALSVDVTDLGVSWWNMEDEQFAAALPEVAAAFIVRFDDCGEAQPFSFSVTL